MTPMQCIRYIGHIKRVLSKEVEESLKPMEVQALTDILWFSDQQKHAKVLLRTTEIVKFYISCYRLFECGSLSWHFNTI